MRLSNLTLFGQDGFLRKQCPSLALKDYKQGPEAKQSMSVACKVKMECSRESCQPKGKMARIWYRKGRCHTGRHIVRIKVVLKILRIT